MGASLSILLVVLLVFDELAAAAAAAASAAAASASAWEVMFGKRPKNLMPPPISALL